MRKKLLALLLMALLLFDTGFAATKATLTKQAKLYTKASTKSDVYCTLNKGDEVSVLATSGSVAKVQYNGKTLFMAKSALKKGTATPTPKPTAAPESTAVLMTTLSDAKAYKSKSLSAKSASVKKGTVVQVYAIDGEWYTIKKSGTVCYLPSSAFEADKSVTKKVQEKTKVYKNSSFSSAVLGSVSAGTALTVLSESGSWVKVQKGKSVGYVPSAAFEKPAATPTVDIRTVVAKSKVYKSNSLSAQVLGTVGAGAKLTVLSKSGSWYKVQKGSSVGWVQDTAFVAAATPTPTAEPTPTPTPKAVAAPKQTQVSTTRNSAKVEEVIDAAMDKLGLPYVFSATGPYSYDCSGLTLYAFRRVGISLAHSAYTQGYGASVRLTMSQLQRGDLVFFNTNKSDGDSCDHVGIYLGDGRFIHASSGKGRVIISDLTTGYYASVFSWGRKLL